MNTIKNLAVPTQRHLYFPASWQFENASAFEATRGCKTLVECTGQIPMLIADAYLMGGEL